MKMEKLCENLKTRHVWLREMYAEFLGTFILLFIGQCSVAQSVTTNRIGGEFISINFAFGFAVTLGILVSGGLSGAHINPSVTLALAVVGKFPWNKVPHYMVAQYLGAFMGSVFTYLVYYEAVGNFSGGELAVSGPTGTAGIWATYPSEYLSLLGGLFDQIMGTCILLMVVCAVTDPHNNKIPQSLVALYIGLCVVALGMSLGVNCGYALNPARDLAPRIFVMIAGWGTEAFTLKSYWWVPVIGPHLGAILGTVIYVFMIEIQIRKVAEETGDLREVAVSRSDERRPKPGEE